MSDTNGSSATRARKMKSTKVQNPRRISYTAYQLNIAVTGHALWCDFVPLLVLAAMWASCIGMARLNRLLFLLEQSSTMC